VDFLGALSLTDTLLLWGLCAARIAAAFLLLPLFSQDVVPVLVRNAIFMSLAALALTLQGPALMQAPLPWGDAWGLLVRLGREVFIGASLGFFWAVLLWAFEAAGQIIDTKIGATMAQIVDPLGGHQTSLNGALLSRLAGWVFMSSGGFMLMVGSLLESYALWPLAGQDLALWPGGARLFESAFGRLMALSLLIAAPALLLSWVMDMAMGLINRFAPQLNLSAVASSLKSIAVLWLLWLQLAFLAELLADQLMKQPFELQLLLQRLLK
jgi:type III secretion protein T